MYVVISIKTFEINFVIAHIDEVIVYKTGM